MKTKFLLFLLPLALVAQTQPYPAGLPLFSGAPPVNPQRKGSIIVANINGTSTGVYTITGAQNTSAGCTATTNMHAWPTAGFLRIATVTTSSANGQTFLRANLDPDCAGSLAGSVAPFVGGVIIPALAPAGAYVSSDTTNYYHAAQGSGQYAGFGKVANVTAPTAANVFMIASEFVDDAGLYATVLGCFIASAPTASATRYTGFFGGPSSYQTNELIPAIPAPFASTLANFTLCTSTTPTNNATVTINKNGVATAITLTIASTDPSQGCYIDSTHTVSLAAGDYFDIAAVTGASTTPILENWYIQLTPASGTSTMLGGEINATVNTSAKYSVPGTDNPNSTAAGTGLGMPIACTASNLYVVQATANGAGVTTTFTLEKNGADTALTGTVTSASGTGSFPLDTTHTVAFVAGDVMTLKYVTASGTSGTIGGWAIQCQ
jgi:hypothetical protein